MGAPSSVVVFAALGSLGWPPRDLKGVYESSGVVPSWVVRSRSGVGGSGLGGSGKASLTLSAPDLGPVGGANGLGGPRVT